MNDRLKAALDHVQAEDELKVRTLEFLSRVRFGSEKSRRLPYRRMMAAAACFAALMFGASGYYLYFQPVFAISVDVNPSVELEINRLDRVISAEAYNEDGYVLLSSLDIRYRDYKEALEQILDSGNIQSYLAQDQPVEVTISGNNEKKSKEMLDHVTAYTAAYQNVHCGCVSADEVSAAHASGMSFGKYRAFLELQALDPKVTPADVQELTMCQIWDRIDTLSGDSQGGHGHGHGGGHGAGHGRGGHN